MKINANVEPEISNCVCELTIVWEPLARIIGTQHVLINLTNVTHELRQIKSL
jgi:hypothetical protein